MTVHYLPTAADRIRIERAGAHACAPELLTPEARLREGVTDLDVARLLEALERGIQLRVNRLGRWFAPVGSPLGRQVSVVVQEAIRTGLVVNVPWDRLIPALVHLKAWDGERWGTSCQAVGENMGPKRVRMVAEPVMADCLACLDRL